MASANADLIRRWNQSNSDPAAVRELAAPDLVVHLDTGDVHGTEEWIAFQQQDDVALHDVEAGIDELIETGSLIGERWWMRGITKAGDAVRWRGITMHRVADGRIQEEWVVLEED